MTCDHNFLGEAVCEHCGMTEHDFWAARCQVLREFIDRARPLLQFALNARDGKGATVFPDDVRGDIARDLNSF